MFIHRKKNILFLKSEDHKFTLLYQQYFHALVRFVKTIVHSDILAEEVAQETFRRLLNNLDKIDVNDERKTKAYLVKIAMHIAYDTYVIEVKQPTIDFDSCQEVLLSDSSDPVWDEVHLRWLKGQLKSWIGELSERERLVLRYRLLEGWSYQEIEKTFHIPISTASSIYARTRKKLWKKYQKLHKKGGLEDGTES